IGAPVLGSIALLASIGPALARQPAAPAAEPPQVRQLIELLNDPAVRGWLEQRRAAAAAAPAAAEEDESASEYLARRADLVRGHLARLVAAAPRFPGELGTG